MLTGLLALALASGTGWGSRVTLEQRLQGTVAAAADHMTSYQGHVHSIADDRESAGKVDAASMKGLDGQKAPMAPARNAAAFVC